MADPPGGDAEVLGEFRRRVPGDHAFEHLATLGSQRFDPGFAVEHETNFAGHVDPTVGEKTFAPVGMQFQTVETRNVDPTANPSPVAEHVGAVDSRAADATAAIRPDRETRNR